METREIINKTSGVGAYAASGLYYLVKMKDNRSFIVLGTDDFSDKLKIEGMFEKNSLGVSLKPAEKIFMIDENQDEEIKLLSERVLVESPDLCYKGTGNLRMVSYTLDSHYYLTRDVVRNLIGNNNKGYFADAYLFLIKYHDAGDKDINPFHQTSVLAKDELDLRSFIEDKKKWFNYTSITIEDVMRNSELRPRHGVVVVPGVININGRD